ncbi:hypothetical protein SERLADRAFT_476592 [Serpula lacrymans var. lacrymans S7.9]|uniref:Uncharacterized protein n=1 Tax=Serpula lacrymans var. lacrymans (strain S7.9) TaxID=578457 RepID=F8P7K8_SERL9|nr:uncharacterized protein SERLADRAFT_476592 [Serpula lacrymans var. lacrymans S7.9]EGO21419.1 hypothetical protein SERLADRAFT_476592 [Serpula lacrymans var. lacrymans S7.9]
MFLSSSSFFFVFPHLLKRKKAQGKGKGAKTRANGDQPLDLTFHIPVCSACPHGRLCHLPFLLTADGWDDLEDLLF